MKSKLKIILQETKEHIPFTLFATLIAIVFALALKGFNLSLAFEVVHPLHLFASAIVSAGIFYKHKNNFVKAFLIGVAGSVLIGSLSDVFFPYLGGSLMNLEILFHLPLIENPFMILGVSIVGSLVGIKTKTTELPHFIHVFLSIFASLFYLIAFSSSISIVLLLISFFVVFISVLLPCCVSDIIFPLLFLKKTENIKT